MEPTGARVLGERLEQVQERFERWRETRAGGEHIPGVLWAAAVDLARKDGVQRIARELGVAPAGLQKRLQKANDTRPVGGEPRFVELFAPTAAGLGPACECVVELANGRGATMRVELNGAALVGLASLCAAFWSAS